MRALHFTKFMQIGFQWSVHICVQQLSERASEREGEHLKNIYAQHSFVFVWFRIKSGKFASPCMMWDCILLDHFSVRLITLSRPHTLSYLIFAMNAIKLHANYNFECKWIIFNRCPNLSIFLFTLCSQPSSHSPPALSPFSVRPLCCCFALQNILLEFDQNTSMPIWPPEYKISSEYKVFGRNICGHLLGGTWMWNQWLWKRVTLIYYIEWC